MQGSSEKPGIDKIEGGVNESPNNIVDTRVANDGILQALESQSPKKLLSDLLDEMHSIDYIGSRDVLHSRLSNKLKNDNLGTLDLLIAEAEDIEEVTDYKIFTGAVRRIKCERLLVELSNNTDKIPVESRVAAYESFALSLTQEEIKTISEIYIYFEKLAADEVFVNLIENKLELQEEG